MSPDAPFPSVRRIAGYPATWTAVKPDVQRERDVLETVPCAGVELYTLSDPEESIDAAALLRERVIADPPYWALVWTGARAIAAVVSSWPVVADAKILDLGCGLGLAGLAAAARGASVVFGDYLEEPVEFVRATLARSGFARCEARLVDFTRDEDAALSTFDLILAADIVYDPAHYAPLAAFLERHLANGGTILLTESLRADASIFLAGMVRLGFRDDRQSMWVIEDGRRERTWMHVLTRNDGC